MMNSLAQFLIANNAQARPGTIGNPATMQAPTYQQDAEKARRDQDMAQALASQGYIPNSGIAGVLAQVVGGLTANHLNKRADAKLSEAVAAKFAYDNRKAVVAREQKLADETRKDAAAIKREEAKAIAGAKARHDFAIPAKPKAPAGPTADARDFAAYLGMSPEQRDLHDTYKGLDRGKVPQGYRMTADGNMEAIPGGPGDVKKTEALARDQATFDGSINNMDRLATAANEVKNHPGLGGITGLRGYFANIPGGDSADAEAKLNTLKSQVGFGVLQDMRNNSKTGGALGAISDKEHPLLQANLGAIEKAQSKEQLQRSLDDIIKYTEGAKDRMSRAFNTQHPGILGQGPGITQQAPPHGGGGGSPLPIQGSDPFAQLRAKAAAGDAEAAAYLKSKGL